MMKSESAWLGIVRICLRGEIVQGHTTAVVHQVIGQFILDIGQTEYAMDEFAPNP